MINKKEYIRAWQSRVGSRTAYLNKECFTKPDFEYLNKQYKFVCDNINVNKKVIIDYGCGGGMFQLFLFEWEYYPKKYIGIDIAERCIDEAKLNSMCWEEKKVQAEIIEIDPITFSCKELKADVFLMLNVVRYFPDEDYVKIFFKNLNNSNIKSVIFNFKSGERDIYRLYPYKTTTDISNSCTLKIETISELLNNYETRLIEELDKNDCFLFLKRKKSIQEEKQIDNPISD